VNGETLLPVVQLPKSGTIISSLLTFLFPVPPVLPPTIEHTLELLSVAQKYEMTTALTQICQEFACRHEPKFICTETALHVYSLAWKYGLLEEALLAAAETLKRPMTLHDFRDKLEFVPGAALAELWKYRQQVLDNLRVSLGMEEFYNSEVYQISFVLNCVEVSGSNIPLWLNHYLDSVVKDPACLDITTFHLALSSHISPPGTSSDNCEYCKSIPGWIIRNIWTALTAVFYQSIRNVSSTTLNANDESHLIYRLNQISQSHNTKYTP
jgi:hypothetical protein